LTCKEVKKILRNLGFEPRKQKSTSHQHWVRLVKSRKPLARDRLYKVTVDCPKAPFSQILISSMAKQAGVSKKEFYAALKKK